MRRQTLGNSIGKIIIESYGRGQVVAVALVISVAQQDLPRVNTSDAVLDLHDFAIHQARRGQWIRKRNCLPDAAVAAARGNDVLNLSRKLNLRSEVTGNLEIEVRPEIVTCISRIHIMVTVDLRILIDTCLIEKTS